MRCEIIKNYISSFPNPLILEKGEMLRVENKKIEWSGWIWCITETGDNGWVPVSYLKIVINTAELLVDYDATELSVLKGQIYQIEKKESGWVWLTSENGKYGWVPQENIRIIE